MSATTTTDLLLTWQFDAKDMRKAELWIPPPEGSTERLKLYYFATYDRISTYYRWNLLTGRYENAGTIEWTSPWNIMLNLGMREARIDTMARRNKPTSKSRRFKAPNDIDYKWRPVQSNPADLECMTVSGKKPVAYYNASNNTLNVAPRGQPILDDLVVLNLVHLYRRLQGVDFVIPTVTASTSAG
ncbi:hypothetical protein FRB94_012415 [Tulasnella sp. JGI-2019a]|nr:hypothetical protein FRB93_010456 [Tulasnella sp. JGI-2019a]KAG9009143.1 hypothetical protein FRB94_012415 [Tulasnella sp. JGI-2019a]KAG9038350.1 hypothetical protein FRB95_001762 [Tulasnella sp. JGI-2019a]